MNMASTAFPWVNRTCIMGVINRSADSFFSPQVTLSQAIDSAALMVKHGACILDIGGEATNPQVQLASGPSQQAELDSVIPTIEAFKRRFNVMISVDTSKTEVMRQAVAAGADMINDQRALSALGAKELVAQQGVPVCLMHFMQGRVPGSTSLPVLLQQVKEDLHRLASQCESAGIHPKHIILDPGFGQGHYGKNTQENFYLLRHLSTLSTKYPLLVGWSRKSMLAEVLGGAKPDERLYGSVAAALFAVEQGASILRVHDVRATSEALTVWRHAAGTVGRSAAVAS